MLILCPQHRQQLQESSLELKQDLFISLENLRASVGRVVTQLVRRLSQTDLTCADLRKPQSEIESSSVALVEQTQQVSRVVCPHPRCHRSPSTNLQSLANTASVSRDIVESLSVGLALALELNVRSFHLYQRHCR